MCHKSAKETIMFKFKSPLIAWAMTVSSPLSTVWLSSLIVMAALLLSACQKQTASNVSPPTETSPVTSSQPGSQREAQPTNGAPVEFASNGITPDKTNVSYKITVKTDKPI